MLPLELIVACAGEERGLYFFERGTPKHQRWTAMEINSRDGTTVTTPKFVSTARIRSATQEESLVIITLARKNLQILKGKQVEYRHGLLESILLNEISQHLPPEHPLKIWQENTRISGRAVTHGHDLYWSVYLDHGYEKHFQPIAMIKYNIRTKESAFLPFAASGPLAISSEGLWIAEGKKLIFISYDGRKQSSYDFHDHIRSLTVDHQEIVVTDESPSLHTLSQDRRKAVQLQSISPHTCSITIAHQTGSWPKGKYILAGQDNGEILIYHCAPEALQLFNILKLSDEPNIPGKDYHILKIISSPDQYIFASFLNKIYEFDFASVLTSSATQPRIQPACIYEVPHRITSFDLLERP